MVSFEDFKKLDLRVAKIVKVEAIPNRDKLYLLTLDLGDEQRQIVSGIKPYYKPEELEGKLIVIIANLEPKKIAGYESKGMLLAAYNGEKLALLVPDREIEPGTEVS